MRTYFLPVLLTLLIAACERPLPPELEEADPFESLELTLTLDTGWVPSGGPFTAQLRLRNLGEAPITLASPCGSELAMPLIKAEDGTAFRLVGAPAECTGERVELELEPDETVEEIWELRALALGPEPEAEPQRLPTGNYTLAASLTIDEVAGRPAVNPPEATHELTIQDAFDPLRWSFAIMPEVVPAGDTLVMELIVENVSADTVEIFNACRGMPVTKAAYDSLDNLVTLAGVGLPPVGLPGVCLLSGDWWDLAPGDTLRVQWHTGREMTRSEVLAAHRPPSGSEEPPEPLEPGTYTVRVWLELVTVNGVLTHFEYPFDRTFEVVAPSEP